VCYVARVVSIVIRFVKEGRLLEGNFFLVMYTYYLSYTRVICDSVSSKCRMKVVKLCKLEDTV
jgi:hypothetical protein